MHTALYRYLLQPSASKDLRLNLVPIALDSPKVHPGAICRLIHKHIPNTPAGEEVECIWRQENGSRHPRNLDWAGSWRTP